MNLEGLTMRLSKSKVIYYEDADGVMVAKTCTGNCEKLKPLSDYSVTREGLGGKKGKCRECCAAYEKVRYANDRKNQIERSRKRREEHPEKVRESCRKSAKKNKEKVAVRKQRRRAMKKALPANLFHEDYVKTLEYFNYKCALTGSELNLEIEHLIPLDVGLGGTTFGNCYPMIKSLNSSKFKHNVFEWFETNRQRFELSQEKFNNLVEYKASANALTTEEYRNYIYWCHDNPRELKEVKGDPRHSIEIWREATGIQFPLPAYVYKPRVNDNLNEIGNRSIIGSDYGNGHEINENNAEGGTAS
jgi:hypothetical protein